MVRKLSAQRDNVLLSTCSIVAFYSTTGIGAAVELLTASGVVFVTGELVMDSVVEVVGSGQITNSGQLQTLILESKLRPTGQDIRTGVRSAHS